MENNHLFSILFLCFVLCVVNCAIPPGYKSENEEIDDLGEPLILTPLIKQNRIEEAKTAAEVDPSLFLGVKSYAGYLTVNEYYNSSLFFWFFPSESDYENDPVVLWLQGGPGAPSVYGLLEEVGPFSTKSDGDLELREYSWSKTHSVIYIDSPVGTGFSIANGGYAQNQTKVGNDLYVALIQFFTLFPELQDHDFFITGESYAGKYVPSIAYRILQENPKASLKINLQGLAIGNGLTDPINQLDYSDYIFQLGLVDSNTRDRLKDNEREVADLIEQGEYLAANRKIDLTQNPSIFASATGYTNYYNYLQPLADPINNNGIRVFLNSSEIRSAIHVGSTPFTEREPIYGYLEGDIMQSVAPWIAELLSHYRVLFYNGQLDIIVAYPLTVNFLQKLEFDSTEEYRTAQRHIWRVDDDIAGYVKVAGNLTEVLVRNAGHMVPAEQPKWAFQLINRFIRNQPIYDEN